MQVIGNPLDYPVRDIVNKGSKYLIRFLQEKWKNDQSNNNETIQLNNETTTIIKKTNSKLIKKDGLTNKKNVIIYINK